MENKEEKTRKEKKHSGLKVFLTTLLVILILLIIGAGVGYSFINNKLNKINYEDINKNDIEITEGVEEKLSKYRNIVLFGIDDADGYTGRSDCIIIFSINEETKKVKMTSIYRDTYVEVPNHGYTKINHAYAYGGAALAMSTINRNLDLDITEQVTINFNVVKDVVDAVGGVKITVTKSEVSQIPGLKSAGTQTLNGEQALAYGRIRKIDTDYKRTERMRTVVDAVFSKVKKMSVSEMNKLADQILPEVHTNISKAEIKEVMADIPSYSIGESIGWPYNVTGKMINKIWYGIPNTLRASVQRLHKELFEETDYETTETVNKISSNIENKTGVK